MDAPRSTEQRRADALEKLHATHADAWVATASDHAAHLVPLSFAWNDEHVIVAIEATSATARNLGSSGRARIALGGTRDVVMIDATLDSIEPVADSTPSIADRYAGQVDWDPRHAERDFVFVLLRPERVQVWREGNEIKGRTVMRDGAWID